MNGADITLITLAVFGCGCITVAFTGFPRTLRWRWERPSSPEWAPPLPGDGEPLDDAEEAAWEQFRSGYRRTARNPHRSGKGETRC